MNMLKLHNTLTRKKENFVPIDNDHVRVYACGPTVYGRIHVGNARPIVVFDVLVRLLRLRHAKVTYVRNITDVDDKIIELADMCLEIPQYGTKHSLNVSVSLGIVVWQCL